MGKENMHDWSKYIERPIDEVLPELEAEGCVPYDYDEYQNAPENADWWVDDVFENGESYQETR